MCVSFIACVLCDYAFHSPSSQWCGWALASWSLPSFAFAFFVVCFLGTRGVQHHQWYLTKFKETYPRHRKAVIPYLL